MREIGRTGLFLEMEVVVIREITWHLVALDHCQAWHMRERLRVPSEMRKELALTKEHRRIVGVGGVALLDAEKAAINWFGDILGGNMALGEETQTETDTF